MKKTLLMVLLAICAAAIGLLIAPPAGEAQGGPPKFRHVQNAVANRYIVVLNALPPRSSAAAMAQTLTSLYGGEVRFVYEFAFKGFAVSMSEQQAILLSQDSRVEFVEENGTVALNTQQPNATWGLDRIDQLTLPLSTTYSYENTGMGIHAYVLDTGIRPTHQDFLPAGRAVTAADYSPSGAPFATPGCSSVAPIICGASSTPVPIDVTTFNSDCNGHGTHVAGTIGGVTYGVAKRVKLFGVRVANCNGAGTSESVIAGVNWVLAHRLSDPWLSVANLSLGGGTSDSLDLAVRNSIANGVAYVVSAGNNNANASGFSPARVSEALTVGATEINDSRASFSNFGSLVDVHAPGVNITSAWHTSDTATNTISGTSTAAAHGAGATILTWEFCNTCTPYYATYFTAAFARPNVLTNIPAGTPNLMLFTRWMWLPAQPARYTDFDADLRADLAMWRPSSGVWRIIDSSTNSLSEVQWGLGSLGDKIVPGDYNGDAKADRAVWRPSSGTWYILLSKPFNVDSTPGEMRTEQLGAAGDIPVPADYDGDHRTDPAVWTPATGQWCIKESWTRITRCETLGSAAEGDRPVVGQYDYDGKADLAVWRAPIGTSIIRNSSDGSMTYESWGNTIYNDVLVPADYDGDGRTNMAVWRPTDGGWYSIDSGTGVARISLWGMAGDIPVPGDYDWDGKDDLAVWRPSDGVWYIIDSSSGNPRYEYFGVQGDIPSPSAYNRY